MFIEKSFSVQELALPFFKYFADEIVFKSTAFGLQLNLYLNELFAFSGAGKPPQHE
jgi:hypothetical protein